MFLNLDKMLKFHLYLMRGVMGGYGALHKTFCLYQFIHEIKYKELFLKIK